MDAGLLPVVELAPLAPGVAPLPVVVDVPVVEDPVAAPVAGGVVVAPVLVLGGHGIAVPLVPTLPVVDATAGAFGPAWRAAAAAAGDPDCASGPASVALLTVSFDDVVVPVELLMRLCGSLAAAASDEGELLVEDGVLTVPAAARSFAPVVPPVPVTPGVVVVEAAPATGTHGAEAGVVDDVGVGAVVVAGLVACELLLVVVDEDAPCVAVVDDCDVPG